MSSLAINVAVPVLALALGACSVAPQRLPSPVRLASYVTLSNATYARIPNAVITVSRCFRARGLLPICEFVPLAEYRSDEQGRLVVFIAVEGFYTFNAIACLNGEQHTSYQSIEVSTGGEVLEPFELQSQLRQKC
jgi:hypothetical protein